MSKKDDKTSSPGGNNIPDERVDALLDSVAKPTVNPDDLPGIGLDKGDLFLDPKGREIVDPIPMAPPVGYRRQPTMVEIIRQQIQGEALAAAARASEMDTWEEADDFDVGDDFEPNSPWEEQFDPVGYRPGALQAHEARFQELQRAQAETPPEAAPGAGTAPPSAPGGAKPKAATPPASPAATE